LFGFSKFVKLLYFFHCSASLLNICKRSFFKAHLEYVWLMLIGGGLFIKWAIISLLKLNYGWFNVTVCWFGEVSNFFFVLLIWTYLGVRLTTFQRIKWRYNHFIPTNQMVFILLNLLAKGFTKFIFVFYKSILPWLFE
jgi:hypothetical protein